MWENIAEPDGPRITLWRMRIECCITKSTNTLRICNTYCFSITKVVSKRASMLRYMYIACIVLYYNENPLYAHNKRGIWCVKCGFRCPPLCK